MNKISQTQTGQMMKMAGSTLRALSEENATYKSKLASSESEAESLREKVAQYERTEKITKIAKAMEAKGLNPHLSLDEKIDSLRENDKLDVVEEAINMQAPQMKTAHVVDDGVHVEGGSGSQAETNFANSIAED